MNKSQQIHQHIVTAKPSEMINLYNFKELTAIDPSGFSIFIYAYCYAGLFTGPYYKFRTFQDTLEWPDHIPKPSDKFLLRRLQDLPLNAFLFVVTSYFVNTKILRSEEFFDDEKYNIFYRLGIFVAIFMLFRLRMYCGWILSECLCMSLQLGAYPIEAKSISGEGPTDLSAFKEWKQERKVTKDATKNKPTEENLLLDSYDFKTIENISIWGCEFMPTIREGMKSWNKTVQYWLAINIYKRCYGPRYFKTLMTMVVSAYWHGLYPGYYLAFLSIVLALWAESSLEVIVSVLGSCLPPNSLSFLRWIMKMRIFEYCTIAFLIKDLETTLRIWSSVHYVMHLICLVIICLAVMLQFLGIYQKPYSDDSKSK